MHGSSHSRTRTPAAFTLVEALLAIAFTATAGSVLLLGIGGSLQTTSDILHETIAQGMAQQLMDEVLGGRYAESGPYGATSASDPRVKFDDAEDYDRLRIEPPEDPWGIELGKEDGSGSTRHVNFWAPTEGDGRNVSFFQGWRQEVDVTTVGNVGDPTRAIEVRIIKEVGGVSRELARLRRVVAYVP